MDNRVFNVNSPIDDKAVMAEESLTDLEVKQRHRHSERIAAFKKCAPFIINKSAVLVHRPKTIEMFKLGNRVPHYGVTYLCGNMAVGKKDKFQLVSMLDDEVVCARCEDRALEVGLPSSSQIVGKHVCIGGVKAFSFCCGEVAE